MKIYGITVVRDEADLIGTTIRYHLGLGCDRILAIDNGSTDGTDEILEEFSSDARVRWRREDGAFLQGELATQAAREAIADGADWIVPFDADEFWYAPWGDFRSVLNDSVAGALRAQVMHFAQERSRLTNAPDALMTMTRRAPRMTGPPDQCCRLVESHQISAVEIMYGPKWVSRASKDLIIDMGNHEAKNLAAPPETTADLVCLHAPYRSRAMLDAKVAHSERLEASGRPRIQHWHIHRLRRLREEGALDAEWAAISYAEETLDVYGNRRPVIYDPTLRDAVAPFVNSTTNALQQPRVQSADAAHWGRKAAREFLTNLHEDVAFHTAWGYELAAELERTREIVANLQRQYEERTRWAQSADQETERARAALATLRQEFEQRTAWAISVDAEIARERAVIKGLQEKLRELEQRDHSVSGSSGEFGYQR